MARNSRLMTEAAPLVEAAREAFAREGGHVTQRVFGERTYAARSWDTTRRIIVKAEHLPPPKTGAGGDGDGDGGKGENEGKGEGAGEKGEGARDGRLPEEEDWGREPIEGDALVGGGRLLV